MSDLVMNIILRPSTDLDVPAMLDIYSYHIRHGLGDFKTEDVPMGEIKRRRKVMLKRRMPHLVADCDGVVVGYAFAAPFRKRPAYRYTVEHSIYVHKDYLRLGIGRQLLPALIQHCTEAGFHQMIAVVDSSNLPSLALHETFGFERAGLLRSVGFKFGHWTDSVLMQRLLAPIDGPPPPDHSPGAGTAGDDAIDDDADGTNVPNF